MSEPVRVCFVCLGNICRSPTAEALMRHRLAQAGLDGRVEVESAGTGDWHVGDPADRRARAEAARRGVAMEGRARTFTPADFARFDLVVPMDRENLRDLMVMTRHPDDRAKVRLLRSFDPAAPPEAEVPDPYFGGEDGFADVFDQVDAAVRGLIRHLEDGPLAA